MTNKLFLTMYGNVGINIQDTSTAMAPILKTFCNNAYYEILRRVNWDGIKLDHQVTTVGGTQDYALPGDFGKELYVYDTTNLRDIPFISLQELADKFASTLASTGSVDRYTIFTDTVLRQPTSASNLTIVSASSSDTTQTVYIRGTNSTDAEISEVVTLTGTTPVTSVNIYKSIRSIAKSAATTLQVTVKSNSDAVTNAILDTQALDYKIKKLRFHYIPSAAVVFNVPYHILPLPLSSDYDTPVFDCADGIELGATMHAWRYKRQFQKASELERLFEKWIADAVWNIENQPNQTHLINVTPYPREF